MCGKLMYLVSFVLVLGLVGDALADDISWDNSSGDSLWRNPENWDLNKLPEAGENDGDAVYINWLSDPTEVIIDAGTDTEGWGNIGHSRCDLAGLDGGTNSSPARFILW